jgi:hypothetical protein
MRYALIILLVLLWRQCLSQTGYEAILSRRLEEIKKLEFYNNKVVVLIDSVEYHDLDFPYWKPNDTYYQDDMVRYKYCQYRVLKDSTRGQRPDTSSTEWAVTQGIHPYLFLRDTAKLEDLRKLTLDVHPYVRCYAFGALSFRRGTNLFPIVISNLKDTTQILEYTGDAGANAYPADLMIEYEAHRFSKEETRRLQELITTKYKYLNRGLIALSQK